MAAAASRAEQHRSTSAAASCSACDNADRLRCSPAISSAALALAVAASLRPASAAALAAWHWQEEVSQLTSSCHNHTVTTTLSLCRRAVRSEPQNPELMLALSTLGNREPSHHSSPAARRAGTALQHARCSAAPAAAWRTPPAQRPPRHGLPAPRPPCSCRTSSLLKDAPGASAINCSMWDGAGVHIFVIDQASS
jgi:hypothetical protein